jgi:hypothetical protein
MEQIVVVDLEKRCSFNSAGRSSITKTSVFDYVAMC